MAAPTRKMRTTDARIKQPANRNLEKIKNIIPVKLRNCVKKGQITNLKLKT